MNEAAEKVNRSVDNVPSNKQQQLLKLSFFNSPNSPMNCSSFNNTQLAENVFQEAKKISKRFADSGDSSFEDLNDVSQQLVEVSDTSLDEFQEMNVHSFKDNSQPTSNPSADKIAMFQERLKSIKQETDRDSPPLIKQEPKEEKFSPSAHNGGGDAVVKNDDELDSILQNIKSTFSHCNKEEAKKQLQRLNELLGKQSASPEQKNTLHVQPIVRQDTFDIDPITGKRKYNPNNGNEKTETNGVMEKLVQILGAQSLDVHSIDLGGGAHGGTQLVVVVPNTVATPAKKPPPRHTLSMTQKPQSAMKALENRKHATPMKLPPHVKRLSSLTAPRPAPPTKSTNDQKSRVGAVRKSLLHSMEKSPQAQKPRASMTPAKAPTPRVSLAPPRRSVSMKAAIPAVQVTNASPMKPTAPKPSTGAPYAASVGRRLSQAPSPFVRPSTTASRIAPTRKFNSQFKTPSNVRKDNNNDGSLV